MLKSLKYFFILIGVLLLFTTCKKYPENNLWFKNPEKVISHTWFLSEYRANGIDSTNFDDLRGFRESGLIFSREETGNKIRYIGEYSGSWSLENKKKYILIYFGKDGGVNPSFGPQKNIFVSTGLKWKIERLSTNLFWISTTYNNTNYEIRFKN